MLLVCPHCQAENEDVARFCNQCGQPLDNSLPENRVAANTPVKDEPATETSSRSTGVNWAGLLIVVMVMVAIWYIAVSKPAPADPQAAAAPMMEQVLEQVGQLKQRLDENPGDVETIRQMYELYSQVGKTGEVTPYTRDALQYILENSEGLEEKDLGDRLLALFIAAYEYQDDAVSIEILEAYHNRFPENKRVLKVLGDLSYDTMQFEQAIGHYERFIAEVEPDDRTEDHLNAMTDLGSCYIQIFNSQADAEQDEALLVQALETFDQVLAINPDFWQAHYNRGVAFGKQENVDAAISEWEWCRDNSDDPLQTWRAEFAIAEIQGLDPPAMPSNPHGEGMMDMGHAHGEGMNPHSEGSGTGSAPPLDGNNMPPNPHSEEFLEQHSSDSTETDV